MSVEIAQLEENIAQTEISISRWDRVKQASYAAGGLSLGVLGYGVIDSVQEADVNVAPLVVGGVGVFESAVGVVASKIGKMFRENEFANYARQKASIERSRRLKAHRELKNRAMVRQIYIRQGYIPLF